VVWVTGSGDKVPVLEENRIPVVHVTCVEPVEVVESKPVCPAIERTSCARLPSGRVVVLSDPSCHVAVLPQDLANRAAASRQDARVAVVSCGRLGNACECRGMMISARYQRCSRGTTQRCRVEAVVPQPLGSKPVHRR